MASSASIRETHMLSTRYRYAFLVMALAAAAACSGYEGPVSPTPPVPPVPTVLLKDIEIPNLPSPFYHFEYDTDGRVTAASFASGLRMYDVTYDRGRIKEMRNNVLVNHDELIYAYDDAGRVSGVRYRDSNGETYALLVFSYEGQKLTGVERDHRVDGGFIIDKTMSLAYDADGNLFTLTEHRPAIDGEQTETTTIDRFELYDDKINVDGFSLIHDDFFDHFVLLPGVQLQKGNPGRVTRTGDGLNFTVDYTYTYDDSNRPLTKIGQVRIANGPDAGRVIQTTSVFTYY